MSVLRGGSNYAPALPRSAVDMALAPARSAEDSAAKSTGTTVLDFINRVCTAELCAAKNDGIWTYRDFEHLSVATAKGLAGEFKKVGTELMKRK